MFPLSVSFILPRSFGKNHLKWTGSLSVGLIYAWKLLVYTRRFHAYLRQRNVPEYSGNSWYFPRYSRCFACII